MNLRPELIPKLLEFEDTPSAADEDPSLRYKRTVNVSSVYRKKKTPDGKPACRRCAKAVPQGRRTWCSDVCVADALIRCQPATARAWVEIRDNGVCNQCGLDTKALKKAFQAALRAAREHDYQANLKWSDSGEAAEVKKRLWDLGLKDSSMDFWDMDHRLEVINGGGHCSLSNLVTLCKPCHKAKTKVLAGERAAAKRSQRTK